MRTIHITPLIILTCVTLTTYPDFITYKVGGGRLGDHLIAYSKAKFISHLSGLPISCPPFEWSDQLALHTLEKYTPPKKHTSVILDQYPSSTIKSDNSSITTGHICTLKTLINNKKNGFSAFYFYTKENHAFKSELKRMINPITSLQHTSLPKDMVTVAVHVRKGGGYDAPLLMNNKKKNKPLSNQFADQRHPKRFPPDTFYIEQIKAVARLYNNKPLFVHIFTDDKNPLAIVDRFKQKLSDLNITFSCRTSANSHNTNVLDDLFDMMRFEVLIRPASSFSKIAQLLGDHQVIIYPRLVHWEGNTLIVDTVRTINHNT